MNPVTFQVVRSSDRELLDVLREMVSAGDGKPACQKMIFIYLSGDQFEIGPSVISTHEELNSAVVGDVRVFSSVALYYPGAIVKIGRHQEGDGHRDNERPFDQVTVSPQQNPSARDFARVLAFAQQCLRKFSTNALGVFLGEQAQKHFEARDFALARLEGLVAKLTGDLENARQQQEQSLHAKEQRLDQRFDEKERQLQDEIDQQKKRLEERAGQLDEREKSLNLQDAKSQRRKEREEFKTTLKEWSKNFDVTQGTKRLRLIIHALSIALLGLFGTAAALYLYQSIQTTDTAQLITAAIKQTVFTALFVAAGVFYARWNTHWFQKRANEEFRLKRMELDFNRASWFVELVFQWREDYKDQPLPPELVERLTTNLFVTGGDDLPPQHPYEALGPALVGALARLKLGPAGVEMELGGKGLNKLKREGK